MVKIIQLSIVLALISLFTPESISASEGAEVFDIQKGEVVRSIPNSNALQKQAKELLASAVGFAGSLRIEPSDGIAIRIPLTPPQKLPNRFVSGTVTEVILFVGRIPSYKPTMLVFTKENQVVAVQLSGGRSLKAFLKAYKLYSPELKLGLVKMDIQNMDISQIKR
ncbi:hypothetical protein [Paenibacillus aestuarii]|uniref:Copper amine oxidase-like N-terminal domain-containing protein n=1 Tax=Paenibacillus aestuarii TaxID=516965 RepID=A0ABW0K1Y5_9BACL|nr:hypothetical protein [Paenibacillus aestuarii]